MWKADALEKILMLAKTEGKRKMGNGGWDDCTALLTQWTWVWANSGDSEGQGSLACCSPWGPKELDMTERLNNNNKVKMWDAVPWFQTSCLQIPAMPHASYIILNKFSDHFKSYFSFFEIVKQYLWFKNDRKYLYHLAYDKSLKNTD